MRDAIATILACAEADSPRLSNDEIACWHAPERESLQEHRILVRAGWPTFVTCPGCDEGHGAIVLMNTDEEGSVERYVMCPEAGRTRLSEHDLCEWLIDLDQFGRHLRDVLELKGTFRVVAPQRLWRLGGILWEGVERAVHFAVGLGRPDAMSVMSALGPGGSAVVFVPATVPPRSHWPGLPPAVVSLRDSLRLTGGRWTLEVPTALASIRDTDQLNKATRDGLIADPNFRKVVGAIAATKKTGPSDKDILDALELCNGNQSKAAKFLNSQHMPIHPGTLSRRLAEIEIQRAAEKAVTEVERGSGSFSKGFTGKRHNGKKI